MLENRMSAPPAGLAKRASSSIQPGRAKEDVCLDKADAVIDALRLLYRSRGIRT